MIVFRHLELFVECKTEIDKVAVLQHTALRLSGGAGGVDQREQRVCSRRRERDVFIFGQIIDGISREDHAAVAVDHRR